MATPIVGHPDCHSTVCREAWVARCPICQAKLKGQYEAYAAAQQQAYLAQMVDRQRQAQGIFLNQQEAVLAQARLYR